MAIEHFFGGPAVVKATLQTPGGGGYGSEFDLGVNREAIPIIATPQLLDVPCDDFGGTEGSPADVQYMGAIVTIQLSLTKYEKTVMEQFMLGFAWTGATVGQIPPLGAFVRQNDYSFKLRLVSANIEREFYHCFVRNGGATGQGSRYASYDLQVEAHMNSSSARQLFTTTLT